MSVPPGPLARFRRSGSSCRGSGASSDLTGCGSREAGSQKSQAKVAHTTPIVVVSYNSAGILGSCLEALLREEVDDVVVVDNASSDGTAELVASRFPEFRLLQMGRNAGFGTAANAGVRATVGTHVLLINPDAWPAPGAIRQLVEHAVQDPGLALVGPRLIHSDGRQQRSVIRHPSGRTALVLATALPRVTSTVYSFLTRFAHAGGIREIRGHEFVMGAAILLRRDAFEEIGGFDEDFFMYDEEVDLELRLRQAGWRVGFFPSATFAHIGGASSTIRPERMYKEQIRSHLRLIAKQEGRDRADSTRRLLIVALRFSGVTGVGDSSSAVSAWLAANSIDELLKTDP